MSRRSTASCGRTWPRTQQHPSGSSPAFTLPGCTLCGSWTFSGFRAFGKTTVTLSLATSRSFGAHFEALFHIPGATPFMDSKPGTWISSR